MFCLSGHKKGSHGRLPIEETEDRPLSPIKIGGRLAAYSQQCVRAHLIGYFHIMNARMQSNIAKITPTTVVMRKLTNHLNGLVSDSLYKGPRL